MKKRYGDGFTLVEVIIVIAIIAILATISIVSYTVVQQNARDGQRQSQVTLIAEGLEKYYDKNGEYPSPAAITNNIPANTGTSVSAKLSVNKEALLMPKAATGTTNSITSALGSADVIAYKAKSTVNNNSCQTSATSGCDEFTLAYKKEQTGQTVTIKSRHSGREAGFETKPEAPARPTITATQSGTNITAVTPVLICESGLTAKYSFQHKAGSGVWTAWTAWQNGRTWTRTSNTNGVIYQFQVKVRCDSPSKEGDESQVSTPVSVTYIHTVIAPTTPTITTAASGANVIATSSTVTCQSGETVQYKIDFRTDPGAWTDGTWGTGRTYTVTNATQGATYGFRATARCMMGSDIQTSGVSPERTYTVPVTAPSGLTISAAISGSNAVGTAAGGICGTGAAIERQIRYHSTPTSTDGTWSSYITGASRSISALQGYKYTFQQQARCTAGTTSSAWVASGTANAVRPISAPSAPSIAVSTSGDTTTYTRNNVTCPSGTTTRYQYKYIDDSGYNSSWFGPTTGVATVDWNTQSQGYQYQLQMQAQCYTVHNTSGWSGTGTGSYIRPVAAPGPISYSISRGGVNNEAHLYATSSCGPGVYLYSRADIHTWDYRWLDSWTYGWYANSHGGAWTLNSWDYWGNSVHTGTTNGSNGPYASGSRWNIATDMMCKNYTTGRSSTSTGRRESGVLYLP